MRPGTREPWGRVSGGRTSSACASVWSAEHTHPSSSEAPSGVRAFSGKGSQEGRGWAQCPVVPSCQGPSVF